MLPVPASEPFSAAQAQPAGQDAGDHAAHRLHLRFRGGLALKNNGSMIGFPHAVMNLATG